MVSRSGQSSFNAYDLSSDDEEYVIPNNVAETTSGRSDDAACLLTAPRLYVNSRTETPKNWGEINPNLNDYDSDPMEISSTFWIPIITEWWRQQEEMHLNYTNLSNPARNIFDIIPHGVRVEARFSLGRDVISWRQSKTKGETLQEEVVVRQFARANNGILADADAALGMVNTENDSEMKNEVEERKLYKMAKSPLLFGDVVGQPKPICYPGGISRSKQSSDSHWIHFGYGRNRQSILVTLST